MTANMLETPVAVYEELAAVTAKYGLQLQKAISYRKIWRLQTSAGFKYLKQSKLVPAEIFFINEVLNYLNSNCFNSAPRFQLGVDGNPFVEYAQKIYVMTDWFVGEELDYNDLNDLRRAILLLAEFHQKSQGFRCRDEVNRTAWYGWPAKFERRLCDLADFRRLALAEKDSSAFSRLYLRHFEPFYRQANLSRQRLLDSFYQTVACEAFRQKQLCHHDYSARNIIRADDRRLILVDFDYCLRDIRIHDLLNLILRNLKHHHWQSEICRFILTEYHQAVSLTPEEIEVMYVLLSWPNDFWQIGLQYYYEKLPWPESRFLNNLEHKISGRFLRNLFLKAFPMENGIFQWRERSERDGCRTGEAL